MTATVVEMPLLFTGDIVTIDPAHYSGQDGIEFVVHETKRSNASIKIKGQPLSRGFSAKMEALIPTGEHCMADIAVARDAAAEKAAEVRAARAAATPKCGAVVTLNQSYKTYLSTTLMSVVKVNDTTVALHRLGGDNPGERGVRIDPRGVTIVPMNEVAARLGA